MTINTRESLVEEEGMRGRWNLICDPTAPGSGGAEKAAATPLIVSIHDWHS